MLPRRARGVTHRPGARIRAGSAPTFRAGGDPRIRQETPLKPLAVACGRVEQPHVALWVKGKNGVVLGSVANPRAGRLYRYKRSRSRGNDDSPVIAIAEPG